MGPEDRLVRFRPERMVKAWANLEHFSRSEKFTKNCQSVYTFWSLRSSRGYAKHQQNSESAQCFWVLEVPGNHKKMSKPYRNLV